ncbi:ParE family toxin-like protein [Pseudomonas mohnii]
MSTIEHILANCPHQVSPCHQRKAIEIDQALRAGISFIALGGKRVRCRSGLVRFKLGCDWRLLYLTGVYGYFPHSLVSRQSLERELKRRRVLKP